MPIAVGHQPIAWLAWAAQKVHRVLSAAGLGCIGGSGRRMSLLISFPGAERPPVSGDVKTHVTSRGRNCRDRDILRVGVDVNLYFATENKELSR
jgi:hypothetical protein